MPGSSAGEFFQRYASDFEAIYGGGNSIWSRLINRRFRRSMRLRFERSLEVCSPAEGKSILDVGCGPGLYGVALARMGAARVLGVDAAPAMVELARAHALKEGVADRCEFVRSDWEKFASTERFDHVLCMGFLEYLAAPGRAIAKIMDHTRRSAAFSLPDRTGFLAWQRRVRYRFKTPLFMYDESEVRGLFENLESVAEIKLDHLERDYFVAAFPTDK
jgi:SAM-dependent methyltransferase